MLDGSTKYRLHEGQLETFSLQCGVGFNLWHDGAMNVLIYFSTIYLYEAGSSAMTATALKTKYTAKLTMTYNTHVCLSNISPQTSGTTLKLSDRSL